MGAGYKTVSGGDILAHASKLALKRKRRRAYFRGRWAEMVAGLLLRAKGYQILARGYRKPVGEVDIIARRGHVLVAIEVKSRERFVDALEAISPKQRRRIARALQAFLQERPDLQGLDLRFDVLLVTSFRHLPRHIEAAWE
ncbi:MAG: YraN family protein [Sneathiella sp.]|jgi:putative endonuclease|nr:YraN family protein [Sneathiella sp.]